MKALSYAATRGVTLYDIECGLRATTKREDVKGYDILTADEVATLDVTYGAVLP